MHRDAQRALKESAYSLKNTIEVVCRDSRTLMQCAGLFALLTQAQYAGLIPNRLDEIKDKEYAREAILTARRAYTAAISALSPEERSDYEFLLQYAGARRYLWAEADHASKRASDVEASGHAAFERLQWLIAHEPSALLAATKEAELEDKRQSISSRLGWFGGGVGLLSLTGLAFEPLITVGGGVVFVVSAAVGLVIRKVPQTARAAHAAIEYEIASLRALLPGIDTSLSSEQQYRANAIANRDQLEAKIRGFVSRYKELEQWF
jgi:hypothetical protein